jgi:uncharacterized membrane protein YqjE
VDTETPSPSGLLGSLRGFADGLIGSVHDRVELLSIEVHEEKHRLIQIILWIAGVILSGMLAIIFAGLALIFLFWDTHRVEAACGLAALYAIAFGVVVVAFRRHLERQPRPFAGTLNELQRDRECIPPEN